MHSVQAKRISTRLIYFRKGDEVHALADYNEAVIQDPKLASAYINRASLFISRAIMIEPSRTRPGAELIQGFRHLREPRRTARTQRRSRCAIADYTRAIELNPTNAMAFRDRASPIGHGDSVRAAADAAERCAWIPACALIRIWGSACSGGEAERAIAEFAGHRAQSMDAQALKARETAISPKGTANSRSPTSARPSASTRR